MFRRALAVADPGGRDSDDRGQSGRVRHDVCARYRAVLGVPGPGSRPFGRLAGNIQHMAFVVRSLSR